MDPFSQEESEQSISAPPVCTKTHLSGRAGVSQLLLQTHFQANFKAGTISSIGGCSQTVSNQLKLTGNSARLTSEPSQLQIRFDGSDQALLKWRFHNKQKHSWLLGSTKTPQTEEIHEVGRTWTELEAFSSCLKYPRRWVLSGLGPLSLLAITSG